MNEQLRESLSALKDGESDELELRRLLSHQHIAEVNEYWERLHRVSDAIKAQQRFPSLDISARVSDALCDEPLLTDRPQAQLTERLTKGPWKQSIAGFAVAASVTVAVVLGGQWFSSSQNILNPQLAPAVASRVYPAVMSNTASLGNVPVSAQLSGYSPSPFKQSAVASGQSDLMAEQRLEKYLLKHTQQSALNNSQRMIDFARVANFEAK